MIAKLAHDLSQRRHNLRRKRVKKPIRPKRFSKTASGGRRLSSYLHKIALHDTGTCDSCGKAETIQHYLTNSSQNEIAAAVKNVSDQRKISFTVPTILYVYVRRRFWKRSVA